MDYSNKPEEQFPDSAYKERLGYHTYDEALIYEGPAHEIRIEFKIPKAVPVLWWPIRKVIEAQVRLKNHKLLSLGLWQGPEVQDPFSESTETAYKLLVTEHGSPSITLTAVAIVAGVALLLGAGAAFLLAIKITPKGVTRLAKFMERLPTAIMVVALVGLGTSLLGAYKGVKPS